MDNLIQQAISKVRGVAQQILNKTTIDENIGSAFNNASQFVQDRRAETRNFLSGAPVQFPAGMQSTYNNPVPTFSNPNSGGIIPTIGKNIFNFGASIPNSIASPFIGAGVDTLDNLSKNIRGVPINSYDKQRSGLTRTGMQLTGLLTPGVNQGFGIKTSAQEVIGNLAEPANALFNVATMGAGGPVANLFKMPVEQGLKQMALRGLKVGAVEGGTMGLLGGLQNNRTNTQNYLQSVVGETAGGTLMGGVLGGGISAGSYGVNKVFNTFRSQVKAQNPTLPEQEVNKEAFKLVTNSLGKTFKAVGGMPETKYNDLTGNWELDPKWVQRQGGFVKVDEFVPAKKGGKVQGSELDLALELAARNNALKDASSRGVYPWEKQITKPRNSIVNAYGEKTVQQAIDEMKYEITKFEADGSKNAGFSTILQTYRNALGLEGKVATTNIKDGGKMPAQGVIPEGKGITDIKFNVESTDRSTFKSAPRIDKRYTAEVGNKQYLITYDANTKEYLPQIREKGVDGYFDKTKEVIGNRVKTLEEAKQMFNSSPSIPIPEGKGINPLIQEAKKYKSAEEFVKGHGETLYHGSPNGIIDKIDVTKLKPNGEMGSGFYLTEDAKMAGFYTKGGVVNEINIGELKLLNTSKGGLDGFVENAIKYGSKEKYIQSLKDAGYDGIRAMDKKEVIIFPESVSKLKTKSQLTDIWNKSQSPSIPSVGAKINPVTPEVPTQPKAPELLPWETPEYLAKNGLKKKITPSQLGTDKIKTELNRPESLKLQSQKIISPELEKDILKSEKLAPVKVNLLDWLRTPDRVLGKLGLAKEAKAIRESYNGYLDQLPVELNKVNGWYEQVKQDPTASQRIFKYLDGQEGVTLNKVEQKVAGEMQAYLKEWADKLDLPYDKRIASYITHIFEPDFIKKDFDEDIAKIIADKIPGSVYDPFLQERLGAKGYVEDAFRALDAYVKRATRKINMDPALEGLQKGGERLPLESMQYVKSYADRINMRPTMVDTLLDNMVKESRIGYMFGQRPITSVSKKVRQAVYRGTLGLNFGSALRNLTQGVNTYAKLGERYTAEGYIKAIPEILSGSNELKASGVLRDNMIQDRQISAFKGVMEKLDSGLFAFFNLAEKINRGSAYFGAKSKYLAEGLSEEQAIKRAVDLVRQTQFTFGSVDTPVALQSDLVKTFTQFQSFNVKQTEFLAEMIKNKELAGGIRWAGANLLLIASVGNLIGLSPKDMIPFSSILSGDSKIGETPPIKLGQDVYGAIINAPDQFNNVSEDPVLTRIGDALGKNAPAFIPGGVQIKKTLQGIQGVQEKGSYNKSGNLQYPIDNTTSNYVRAGLFGKSNLDEAQNYFDTKPLPLYEKQTAMYKSLEGQAQKDFYTQTIAQREAKKTLDAQKEAMKNGAPMPAPQGGGLMQKISDKFNPKPVSTTEPTEATTFVYQDANGGMRTIDTAKINSMPTTSNVEALIKRKEAYKLVDDVYKLPQEQQAKAFSQLGISQADAQYYRIANNDVDVKEMFVRERLTELAQKGGTHDDMLKTLIGLRYQLNGKMVATDTVLKGLYNDGLLTDQEYKEMKDIKVNNGGIRTKRLKAKKGRKPAFKRVKMSGLKKIKMPKMRSIKIKRQKLKLPPLKSKVRLANLGSK